MPRALAYLPISALAASHTPVGMMADRDVSTWQPARPCSAFPAAGAQMRMAAFPSVRRTSLLLRRLWRHRTSHRQARPRQRHSHQIRRPRHPLHRHLRVRRLRTHMTRHSHRLLHRPPPRPNLHCRHPPARRHWPRRTHRLHCRHCRRRFAFHALRATVTSCPIQVHAVTPSLGIRSCETSCVPPGVSQTVLKVLRRLSPATPARTPTRPTSRTRCRAQHVQWARVRGATGSNWHHRFQIAHLLRRREGPVMTTHSSSNVMTSVM